MQQTLLFWVFETEPYSGRIRDSCDSVLTHQYEGKPGKLKHDSGPVCAAACADVQQK